MGRGALQPRHLRRADDLPDRLLEPVRAQAGEEAIGRIGKPAAASASLTSRDPVAAVVEDRGAQDGVRAGLEPVDQVLRLAGAAGRDHRHVDGGRDRARQIAARSRPASRRGPCSSAGSRPRRARRPRAPTRPRRGPSASARRPRRPRTSRPGAAWRRSPARRTARRTPAPARRSAPAARAPRELTLTLSAPASSTACASSTCAHPAADRERHEHVVGGAPRELHDRGALVATSP